MENLVLEETNTTPKVNFNKETHVLQLSGESRPENVANYYAPIVAWIEEYNKWIYYLINENEHTAIKVNANFAMTYFNSTSAKYLFDVLNGLSRIEQYPNVEVAVNWQYDELDEDMLENGEDFEDMTSLKFNFISK